MAIIFLKKSGWKKHGEVVFSGEGVKLGRCTGDQVEVQTCH